MQCVAKTTKNDLRCKRKSGLGSNVCSQHKKNIDLYGKHSDDLWQLADYVTYMKQLLDGRPSWMNISHFSWVDNHINHTPMNITPSSAEEHILEMIKNRKGVKYFDVANEVFVPITTWRHFKEISHTHRICNSTMSNRKYKRVEQLLNESYFVERLTLFKDILLLFKEARRISQYNYKFVYSNKRNNNLNDIVIGTYKNGQRIHTDCYIPLFLKDYPNGVAHIKSYDIILEPVLLNAFPPVYVEEDVPMSSVIDITSTSPIQSPNKNVDLLDLSVPSCIEISLDVPISPNKCRITDLPESTNNYMLDFQSLYPEICNSQHMNDQMTEPNLSSVGSHNTTIELRLLLERVNNRLELQKTLLVKLEEEKINLKTLLEEAIKEEAREEAIKEEARQEAIKEEARQEAIKEEARQEALKTLREEARQEALKALEEALKEEALKEEAFKEEAIQEALKNRIKKKRKTIPKPVRDRVWRKYQGGLDGNCWCCDKNITFENWECGHVKSDYHGGEAHCNNLRPLCSSCNRSMGKQDMISYIKNCGFTNSKGYDEFI